MTRDEKQREGSGWVFSPRPGPWPSLNLVVCCRIREGPGSLEGCVGDPPGEGAVWIVALEDWNKTVLFWFPC